MTRKQKKVLIRIIISAMLLALGLLLPLSETARAVFVVAAYLTIGYDILTKAVKGIISLQPFDENLLMALATVGAFILGEYTECCMVMLLYQIGELFQSCALGRSRKSIASLMDIRPDSACVITAEGEEELLSPEDVEEGSLILIRPGERVPLDAIVTEGSSSLNTSALTGESMPLDVTVGDEISGGTVNISGVLRARTLRPFEESTAAKVLSLIENAASRKSRSEQFISKFARVYTPVVVISAFCLATVPPLILWAFGDVLDFSAWVYRALTFLVISCPCALVISVPLTFFSGLGAASRAGILIKGSNFIESLSHASVVALDKTGTVTEGVFEVSGIHHSSDPHRLLRAAALCECFSSHPISRSLISEYESVFGHAPDPSLVADVTEIPGKGVTAKIEGRTVSAGNSALMREIGVSHIECEHDTGTVVHVASDDVYSGHIVISDSVKANAREAISELKAAGIRNTVMLTGDKRAVGDKVCREIGIDRCFAELLPEGKVEALEEVMCGMKKGEVLVYVGDGINDAPVLSRADVGISMGSLGSDAAIEASDVVIMDDDPIKISRAVKLSRHTMSIAWQNIIFAIAVKIACLILGAFGYAEMWLAIFADVGVMVLAVLNALRANKS